MHVSGELLKQISLAKAIICFILPLVYDVQFNQNRGELVSLALRNRTSTECPRSFYFTWNVSFPNLNSCGTSYNSS